MEAYFVADGATFVPTDYARGPWSPEFLHGGPPAALMARAGAEALARAADAGPEAFQLARLTIELLRPVPFGPLSVRAEVVGSPPGRVVRRVRVTLGDGERVVAEGLAVGVRRVPLALPAAAFGAAPTDAPGAVEAAAPFDLCMELQAFGYARSIEVRLAKGRIRESAVCMWMRPRVALVAGEAPSQLTQLERVFVCADSGSGVSQMLDPATFSFLNADLDVQLLRDPVGDWVCLDARTIVGASGIGVAESRLWDVVGAFGSVRQTLVLRAK